MSDITNGTESKLTMSFKNVLGSKYSIVVDDPKDDLEETDIAAAMDTIITKNIFQPGGYDFIEKAGAKIVNSDITEYDLEI